MDLRSRLDLAGNALLGMLIPDQELMPVGGYESAHDLGRWWDAILRLEEATGFAIPAELEAASLRNLKLQWTPEPSVRLTVDGESLPLTRLGHFAWVSADVLADRSRIVMSYDLPERMTEEEMPSGRRYRFKWRGDEIVGIDPQDSEIPLYPALGAD